MGRCFEFLSNYYGFHRGGDRKSNTKVLCLNEVDSPQNQVELAQSYGITQQTMNNYMRMASMIPELEELVDTGITTTTTTLAIMKNFGRRKNDPSKDRKALATYVELKGNSHGGNRKSKDQNGLLNLDEIAKELKMSKSNLKRALRIERNLNDSMKKFT